jgi:hypothetical protein
MRVFLAIVVICCLWARPVLAQGDFVDHGVATRAVEGRGVAAVSVPGGGHYVVMLTNDRAKRGWVLITALESGPAVCHDILYFSARVFATVVALPSATPPRGGCGIGLAVSGLVLVTGSASSDLQQRPTSRYRYGQPTCFDRKWQFGRRLHFLAELPSRHVTHSCRIIMRLPAL